MVNLFLWWGLAKNESDTLGTIVQLRVRTSSDYRSTVWTNNLFRSTIMILLIFCQYDPNFMWKCLISPWGQSWERIFPQALLHLCLWKTLSKDWPHGKDTFSNSSINNVKTYNNLLLEAKGRKKTCQISVCNNLPRWNDAFDFISL